MELEPLTEYVVEDVYVAGIVPGAGTNVTQRGDIPIRTDAQGQVWIRGVGRPEAPWFASWCAKHPRLRKV